MIVKLQLLLALCGIGFLTGSILKDKKGAKISRVLQVPGIQAPDWENVQHMKKLDVRGEVSWRTECREWSSQEIYLEGDKVVHNGHFYQAKWWNQATEPLFGWEDTVWESLGESCTAVEAVEAEQEDEEDQEEWLTDNQVGQGRPPPASSEEDKPETPEKEEKPELKPWEQGPTEPPTKAEAEEREANLTGTPLFALVKASISTLKSDKVDAIKPKGAANPENVRRVEKILSKKDWEHIFPLRDPAYSYTRFLQAVGKFPGLCGTYSDGRNSDMICRRSLATMFAHFTQETGGHDPHAGVEQWRQGLVYLREAGCSQTGPGCKYDSSCAPHTWQGKTWPCGSGQKYYGRGAKQLSYNFNYGPFSDAMTGSVETLLKNPDLVASTWFNLASATWFYSYPQPPKPSMLHVLDGTWQPNEEDKKNKLEPGFGATIMIINGGIECGHGYEKPQATNRQEYYKKLAEYLKVDITGEELSCAHMKSFSKDGAGSLYIYWDREWTREFECQLVKYQTPFNALKKGDYVRCVEDQFKVKLA